MDNTFFAGKVAHMIEVWWHWQTHSIFCGLFVNDIWYFTIHTQ